MAVVRRRPTCGAANIALLAVTLVVVLLQPATARAQAAVWVDAWTSGEDDAPMVYGVASITGSTIGGVSIFGWIKAPSGAVVAQSSNADYAGYLDTYFELPLSGDSQSGTYSVGSAGFFDGEHYGCASFVFVVDGVGIYSFHYYKTVEGPTRSRYRRCNAGICQTISVVAGSTPEYARIDLMSVSVAGLRTCWSVFSTPKTGCFAP